MTRIHVAMAVALLALSGPQLAAKESCSCGCVEMPRKICRVVCDVQLVTRFEYYCQRETVCVPGRSRCVLPPCEASTPCSPCEKACKIWVPTCGPVYERSQLYKRPVVCQRQVYRYVVEDVCKGCGQARIDEESTRALAYTSVLPRGAWQPIDAAPTGRLHTLAGQRKPQNESVGLLAGSAANEAQPIPAVSLPGAALPVGYEGPLPAGEPTATIQPLPPVEPTGAVAPQQPSPGPWTAPANRPGGVLSVVPSAQPAVRQPPAVATSRVFGPPSLSSPATSVPAQAAPTGKDPAQGQREAKVYAGKMSNAWEGPYAEPDLMKPQKPGFWDRLIYGD